MLDHGCRNGTKKVRWRFKSSIESKSSIERKMNSVFYLGLFPEFGEVARDR
jgi:hypothetical protein